MVLTVTFGCCAKLRPSTKHSLQAVHIIDPTTLTVTKTLANDAQGLPLTSAGSEGSGVAVGSATNDSRTWNDAVYVEVRLEPSCCCCWMDGEI